MTDGVTGYRVIDSVGCTASRYPGVGDYCEIVVKSPLMCTNVIVVRDRSD